MRKILAGAVMGAMMVSSVAAKADTFLWKDEVHDFTMSFPDVWKVQTEDTPTTRLRIAGPLAEDWATCRMQVWDDGRVKIYPKRLTGQAVMEQLDQEFWAKETAQYKDAVINGYFAPASLGAKGDATAVQFSFTQEDGDGNKMKMQGISLGSIYGGKRFMATCSSRQEMYSKRYADLFLSIIDSTELESRYHPFATAYYRNFLMDEKIHMPRSKPGTSDPNQPLKWEHRYSYNQ